ncbi:hypothetical protein GCM10009727_64560 [Actinomadura napierensis]|uniref:Uncharacterized protein n=1 Tax=Actinomadura napierensis TaxID=267854 RepID=A0ABN3A9D6_9ACTN
MSTDVSASGLARCWRRTHASQMLGLLRMVRPSSPPFALPSARAAGRTARGHAAVFHNRGNASPSGRDHQGTGCDMSEEITIMIALCVSVIVRGRGLVQLPTNRGVPRAR